MSLLDHDKKVFSVAVVLHGNIERVFINTGISQREYREAVKSGQEIDWHCKNCTISDSSAEPVPSATSTMIGEISLLGE